MPPATPASRCVDDDAGLDAERRAVRAGRRHPRVRQREPPLRHRRVVDRVHRLGRVQRHRRRPVRSPPSVVDDPRLVPVRRPARRRQRDAAGDPDPLVARRRPQRDRRAVRRRQRRRAPARLLPLRQATDRGRGWTPRSDRRPRRSHQVAWRWRCERVLHRLGARRHRRLGGAADDAVRLRRPRRDARPAQRRAQPRRRRGDAARRLLRLLGRPRTTEPVARRARRGARSEP